MPYGTLNTGTITPGSGNTLTINEIVDGTAIKDQDNMSSNSATHLATQQSIKAYVDTAATQATTAAQGVGTGDNVTHNKLTATTGVLFGTDTAAANTLDDYEEGIWTATLPVTSGGGTLTPGTTSDTAHTYTRIGNKVYYDCNFHDIGSSGTITGYKLDGFPFTHTHCDGIVSRSVNQGTPVHSFLQFVGTTDCLSYTNNAGVRAGGFSNGARMYFSLVATI